MQALLLALGLTLFLLIKLSILHNLVETFVRWSSLTMDAKAYHVLTILRSNALPECNILDLINRIKADIKHATVPEAAIAPLFELISAALDSSVYIDVAFSTLHHLLKRLDSQDQLSALDRPSCRIIPVIFECLGLEKQRLRSRALQVLLDLWNATPTAASVIKGMINDIALERQGPTVKEAALQFIMKLPQGNSASIYTFIYRITVCLEDTVDSVRQTAKDTLVHVLKTSPTRDIPELRRRLTNFRVKTAILNDILTRAGLPTEEDGESFRPLQRATSGLGTFREPFIRPSSSLASIRTTSSSTVLRTHSRTATESSSATSVSNQASNLDNPDTKSISRSLAQPQSLNETKAAPRLKPRFTGSTLSTRSQLASRSVSKPVDTSTTAHNAPQAGEPTTNQSDVQPLPFIPTTSEAENEAEKLEGQIFSTAREVETALRDILPPFEGTESETNWKSREQNVIKVRKITKGNAYDDFPASYLAGVKQCLSALTKAAESLRTTLNTLTCHCIQDIVRRTGPNLDSSVEILLQMFVKMCVSTKKIAAHNGDSSMACLVTYVSFNARVAQHIYTATQDKNVNPRLFASGWLRIVLTRYGHQKSAIEHNNALDLVSKAITAGLNDRDLNVRSRMRPTYWAFARLWSDKSENILLSLDKKQQEQLLKDASNPFPDASSVASVLGEKAAALSQSTSTVSTRPSIKETIMARKRANKNLPPQRPSSAGPTTTSTEETSATSVKPSIGRLATRKAATATASGTLSSAPVRPLRPARKPELVRPATALGSRTTTLTPATRSTRPKTPVLPTSLKRGILTAKKASSETTTPTKVVTRRISWSDELPGGSLEVGPSGSASNPDEALDDASCTDPNGDAMSGTAPAERSPKPLADKCDDNKCDDIWWQLAREADNRAPLTQTPIRNTAGHPLVDNSPRATEAEFATRISMSPRAVQNLSLRKRPRLQVYEDPEAEPLGPSPIQPSDSNILNDLPINAHPAVFGHTIRAEHGDSPLYHSKWAELEASLTKRDISTSSFDSIQNPYQARRLLQAAIPRIREGTIDVLGLRKVQHLIKHHEDLCQDIALFDDLLLALVCAVEENNNSFKPEGGPLADLLRTQTLITLRRVLLKHPVQSSALFPKALCAVLAARRSPRSTARVVSGLEETAECIISMGQPKPNINAVLTHLEAEDDSSLHSLFMGLYTLAGLLYKAVELEQVPLGLLREQRISRLYHRCIHHEHVDIRRAILEMAVQFYRTIGSEERFWEVINRRGSESIIKYFLARPEPDD